MLTLKMEERSEAEFEVSEIREDAGRVGRIGGDEGCDTGGEGYEDGGGGGGLRLTALGITVKDEDTESELCEDDAELMG